LEFHIGVETVGALVDTTVTASSDNAKQAPPAYSIARIVPQVHALLEIWKVSPWTVTGRYLVRTENTVLETETHALFLKQVKDWKGIGTLTGM